MDTTKVTLNSGNAPGTITPDKTVSFEEKKKQNFASVWMKNKLKERAKNLAEKYSEGSGAGKTDDSVKSEKESEPINKDKVSIPTDVGENVKPAAQHLGGICTKKGECQKTSFVSPKAPMSGFEMYEELENIKIYGDTVEEEEKEEVLKQTKGMLAIAVGMFREYHIRAGEYGLVLLKPIMNIVKPLGEQMGMSEVRLS